MLFYHYDSVQYFNATRVKLHWLQRPRVNRSQSFVHPKAPSCANSTARFFFHALRSDAFPKSQRSMILRKLIIYIDHGTGREDFTINTMVDPFSIVAGTAEIISLRNHNVPGHPRLLQYLQKRTHRYCKDIRNSKGTRSNSFAASIVSLGRPAQ